MFFGCFWCFLVFFSAFFVFFLCFLFFWGGGVDVFWGVSFGVLVVSRERSIDLT